MNKTFTSFALVTLAAGAAAQSGAQSVAGIQLYPGASRSGVEASQRTSPWVDLNTGIFNKDTLVCIAARAVK